MQPQGFNCSRAPAPGTRTKRGAAPGARRTTASRLLGRAVMVPSQPGNVDREPQVDEIASAEEWLEERIPVEPGGTLYVDLDRGSVEVGSHDRPEILIQASARGWSAAPDFFNAAVLVSSELDTSPSSFTDRARGPVDGRR